MAPFSFNARYKISAVDPGVSVTLVPAGSGSSPNGITSIVVATAQDGGGKFVVGQGVDVRMEL